MPRLIPRRARQWKDGELVRPVESFTGDVDGVPFVLNPADRLRADDPVVRRWPHHFVRVDSSNGELGEVLAEIHAGENEKAVASSKLETRPRVVSDSIPVGEAAVASENFYAPPDRYFSKGQRVRRDDPAVQAHPELFMSEPLPIKQAS